MTILCTTFQISRWIDALYSVQTELLWGDKPIKSSQGFHQGDALTTVGFCLVLQPVIKRIKDEIPDLKANAWLMDDGNVVGPHLSVVYLVIQFIKQDRPIRVLYLKDDKSKVYWPSHNQLDEHPLGPEVTWV